MFKLIYILFLIIYIIIIEQKIQNLLTAIMFITKIIIWASFVYTFYKNKTKTQKFKNNILSLITFNRFIIFSLIWQCYIDNFKNSNNKANIQNFQFHNSNYLNIKNVKY